jgi:small subunit ribosomal protein S14
MAKESMKARQRKREAMVAKYAEKRATLKAEGTFAQPLQTYRPPKRLHQNLRYLP